MTRKKLTISLVAACLMYTHTLQAESLATIGKDDVNIRKQPSTASEVLATTDMESEFTINGYTTQKDGVWIEVNTDQGVGHIRKDMFSRTFVEGVVIEDSLEGRSYPDSKNSTLKETLVKGQMVNIYYKVGEYYKVNSEGQDSFVLASAIAPVYPEIVTVENIVNVRDLITGESNNIKNEIETMIQFALKHVGNPYVYGGNSLTNGIDCSGFTQQVFGHVGIRIPRTSREQSKVGKPVTKNEMQRGDLVVFGTSPSKITHVGIYIGNGEMVHSGTRKTGITVSNVYTGGGNPLQGIRRIL